MLFLFGDTQDVATDMAVVVATDMVEVATKTIITDVILVVDMVVGINTIPIQTERIVTPTIMGEMSLTLDEHLKV